MRQCARVLDETVRSCCCCCCCSSSHGLRRLQESERERMCPDRRRVLPYSVPASFLLVVVRHWVAVVSFSRRTAPLFGPSSLWPRSSNPGTSVLSWHWRRRWRWRWRWRCWHLPPRLFCAAQQSFEPRTRRWWDPPKPPRTRWRSLSSCSRSLLRAAVAPLDACWGPSSRLFVCAWKDRCGQRRTDDPGPTPGGERGGMSNGRRGSPRQPAATVEVCVWPAVECGPGTTRPRTRIVQKAVPVLS